MRRRIIIGCVTATALLLGSQSTAQTYEKVQPLSKGLQDKLNKGATPKQGEMLSKLVQSAANYFRSNTGTIIAEDPQPLDANTTITRQLFATDLKWPGSVESKLQVNKTLFKGVPSYESYELRSIFEPGGDENVAKKQFEDLYTSINGSIILTADNKALLIDQPASDIVSDGNGGKKCSIEFTQVKEATGIRLYLELVTNADRSYTIQLVCSKTRMHDKDQ